ncbi:CAP domain-containing protein [Papiliotrema laurentii]|uniref:CAP domain-containing protein n=1 Tax=Papiliotrema laurentii TaxID=5418 RepID=A0AAD9D243_PAPLA|nr:CAP domain-containing protein [Papiliotrema laurentii]
MHALLPLLALVASSGALAAPLEERHEVAEVQMDKRYWWDIYFRPATTTTSKSSTTSSKATTTSTVVSTSTAKTASPTSSAVSRSSTPSASQVVSSVIAKSSIAAPTSSAASAATPAASSISATDKDTLLKLHNDFRAQYGAAPLVWDDTVAAYAQTQANKCVFAHSGGQYGENLAAGVGGGFNAAAGFKGWADEASLYDYNNPGFSSATGHFTQVVWKNTQKLGCAVVNCPNGSIFDAKYNGANVLVWCNYNLPGNYLGQFPANVGQKVA